MKITLHNGLAWNSLRSVCVSIAFLFLMVPATGSGQASAATLDRIKQAGKITFGYRTDARPFSYQDESGKATGYSADLCQRIAEEAKTELGLSSLAVEWVPVTLQDRFDVVQQGKVDLLCGADTATLTRRKTVSFSIPVFPDGLGALLRADAQPHLAEVLTGQPSQFGADRQLGFWTRRDSPWLREQQPRNGSLTASIRSRYRHQCFPSNRTRPV